MKKIILKTSIAFLLLFMMGAGCEKEDQNCPVVAIDGPENDITGKWKLIKGQEVFFNPRKVDYSCNNIVYHFQPDGRLIITGDRDDIIRYNPGEYTYEFNLHVLYEHLKENFTLKIDNIQWACGISGSNLIINNSPVDGPILYLVRIQ